jgi:hypothetical protein
MLDHPLIANQMIAVLDDSRFFDDRFYTFDHFKQMQKTRNPGISSSQIKHEWSSLRENSLYNTLDVVDGLISPKDRSAEFNLTAERYNHILNAARQNARDKMRSMSQIVDGVLNDEGQVAARRHLALMFTMSHRGWWIINMQRAWARQHFNFQTMQMEEGYMRTLFRMSANMIGLFGQENMADLGAAVKDSFNNMQEHERLNMLRLAVYAFTFALTFGVYRLLMGWRDDDDNRDNYLVQSLAYTGLRTINETTNQMPLFLEYNFRQMLENPVVVGNKITSLIDPDNYSLQRIRSGKYAGETRLWRMLMDISAGKQYYNTRSPQAVRRAADSYIFYNRPVFGTYDLATPSSR